MRVNLALLAVLLVSALSVVTSNHRARLLFVDLGREQSRMHDLEVEWGQLQLEQSTWANPMRINKIARAKLGMHPPAAEDVVSLDAVPVQRKAKP